MELKIGHKPLSNNKVWKGWIEIDGKRMYLKSKWEKRYCLYLSLLKKHQYIVDYWYEPKTFYFEGIKRGTTNYKPDWKIEFPNGKFEWHEVKGYETSKDRTKYKRMAKYFPEEKLVVIGKDWFKSNSPKLKGVIKEW